MKKICSILSLWLLLSATLLLSACNLFYVVKRAPKNVYKEFLQSSAWEFGEAEFSEKIADEQSACVVTILATGNVVSSNKTYLLSYACSGIILNDEGYILTTDLAYNMEVYKGGRTYNGKAIETYAVLSDVYQDSTHYKIEYVYHDSDCGLALFRFYDTFYYYSDEQKSDSEKGFQFTGEFIDEKLETGTSCVAVGNSLANIMVENPKSHTAFKDIRLTITAGFLSDTYSDAVTPIQFSGGKYAFSVVTAPINSEMIGGAVFDKEGKILGMIFQKATYGAAESSDYLKHISFIQGAELIRAFVLQAATESAISVELN